MGFSFLVLCLIPNPNTWRRAFVLIRRKKPEVVPPIAIQPFTPPTITTLLMRDFITCYAGNLSALSTTATPDQLNEAWGKILSDYYRACSDDNVKSEVKLRADIKYMEYRWQAVENLAAILNARYNEHAAKILQKFYAQHKLLFTPESWNQDTKHAQNIEVANRRKYKGWIKELEAAQTTPGRKKTVREIFANMFMDINKNEGHFTDWNNQMVETYCVAVVRLRDYIKMIKEQNAEHGRPNK
jgi:hypothetical protein